MTKLLCHCIDFLTWNMTSCNLRLGHAAVSEVGAGVKAAALMHGWPAMPSHHCVACSCIASGTDLATALQCSKLVEEFGLLHLSAGDLLRAHMKSGTPDGNMVAEMIAQGQIVPSRVSFMA